MRAYRSRRRLWLRFLKKYRTNGRYRFRYLPTGYFGAEEAEVQPGDGVRWDCLRSRAQDYWGRDVFFAIGHVEDRLSVARSLGAEAIHFDKDHPVDNWVRGRTPSQVRMWAMESVVKAGTISLVGVSTNGKDVSGRGCR